MSVGAVESACAGCQAQVSVDTAHGVATGDDGSRRKITYADTDIVVWDCPRCGFANADVFGD